MLKGTDKVRAYSVGPYLALDVMWYGEHGICYFNHSSYLAFAETKARDEQSAILQGKNIPYKYSWRENWEHIKADLHDNWHSFNLTSSGVIAYVRVCDITLEVYNTPKTLAKLGVEIITKKHLAKHLLNLWITNEGIKVNFNE